MSFQVTKKLCQNHKSTKSGIGKNDKELNTDLKDLGPTENTDYLLSQKTLESVK